ncbi:MAG: hypothetical protein JWR77_353 [Rhizorhabdus sp.]|nr:hypothetical protein [Rhizorhabdus sp.]
MMSPVRLIAALGLALAPVAGCGPISAKPAVEKVARVPLDIRTAKGVLHFQVEVARTEPEQERGLMYRTSLPERGGMIFPMDPPRWASFWMKNTLIPLDLIFIRADGHIARIAANAVPESLATIESGEPVAAVLEIVGGGAAAAGIEAGDVVHWTGAPAR